MIISREEGENSAVIVFLKNAEKGYAKTRLAAGIGDEDAFRAYLHLLSKTRSLCEQLSMPVFLFYSKEIPDQSWGLENEHHALQSKGNLGDKMKAAFSSVLLKFQHVIIIGSDCPYITKGHITQAFDQLQSHDLVFGPSLDGGYYLMGMNAVHDTLFDQIPWSTDQVLAISTEKCLNNSLSYSLLEPLEDIDEITSWNRYLQHSGYSFTKP